MKALQTRKAYRVAWCASGEWQHQAPPERQQAAGRRGAAGAWRWQDEVNTAYRQGAREAAGGEYSGHSQAWQRQAAGGSAARDEMQST